MFNIQKQFGYGYLPGSNLLHTLGRPLTRSTARNGQTVNDSFVHNSRSELTGATVNGSTYGYAYDNIGNRTAALEESSGVASRTAYTANELNQYTSIQENEEAAFVPTFDTDGNQTLVKTATGLWSVQYNAENRPVRFTSADGATIIECSYDTHGRRATKKVTTNGSITLHQHYIYRGYLQLACCDLTRTGHLCLWLLTWDPTQIKHRNILNGIADVLAGFSDSVLWGYGEKLSKTIYGNQLTWPTEQGGSVWYETGTALGYIADGVSFKRIGKGIYGVGKSIYNGGREIKISKNLRIAPVGNRTGHKYGELPHYHRRGIDKSGASIQGQGIGRHRPWEAKATDKSFLDRF